MDRMKIGMERRVRSLKKIEKYIKGKKILDVGCNAGSTTKYFSEKSFDVTGIDLDKKWVNFAKSKCPKAKILLKDVMQETGKYDTILIIGVLEEIPISPDKVLIKLKENLKEGGIIIIAVRNMLSAKRRFKTLFGLEPVDAFHDRIWNFTRKRLKSVINEAGYTPLNITSNNWDSLRTKTFPTPDALSEEIYAVIGPKKD